MATWTPRFLSNSVSGLGIKVIPTATPGTLIHTAVSGATSVDEVWLDCVNTSTTGVKLTVQWGGTTVVDNDIEQTIAPEDGLKSVVRGLPINATKVIRAFAGTANVLVIYGHVDRRTV